MLVFGLWGLHLDIAEAWTSEPDRETRTSARSHLTVRPGKLLTFSEPLRPHLKKQHKDGFEQ